MPVSSEAPDLVQSLRYHGPGQLQLDLVPSIPCGPNEVRLKVAYCGICGSDIHEYQAGPIFCPPAGGQNPVTGLELPVTMGHEYSGTVTEIGSEVSNVHVGQKVVVDPILHDRHYGLPPCEACRNGLYNACRRCSVHGLSSPGGGLASETVVRATTCIPLPDSISLKVGALIEPMTIAWHAIRISGFKPGQTALVLGAGPIGLAILMLLRVWGASSVLVSEVTKTRAAQAAKLGADLVVNPAEAAINGTDPVKAAVDSKTNSEGVDVAFMAAGHQSILDAAIASTKIGGVIFNAAIHEKPLQIRLNDLVFGEKRLLTGIRCTDEDWEGVIQALEQGKVPRVEELITSVVPLSNAVEGAFLELINNTHAHVKILIQPSA